MSVDTVTQGQLAAWAKTLGVTEHTMVRAWEMAYGTVRDPWLTDEARALRVLQRLVDQGWTPPGGVA